MKKTNIPNQTYDHSLNRVQVEYEAQSNQQISAKSLQVKTLEKLEFF